MSKVPILTVAVVLVVWVALTAYDMRDGTQPAVAPTAPPLLGGHHRGGA